MDSDNERRESASATSSAMLLAMLVMFCVPIIVAMLVFWGIGWLDSIFYAYNFFIFLLLVLWAFSVPRWAPWLLIIITVVVSFVASAAGFICFVNYGFNFLNCWLVGTCNTPPITAANLYTWVPFVVLQFILLLYYLAGTFFSILLLKEYIPVNHVIRAMDSRPAPAATPTLQYQEDGTVLPAGQLVAVTPYRHLKKM